MNPRIPCAVFLSALLLSACTGCAEKDSSLAESSLAEVIRIPETVTAVTFSETGSLTTGQRFLADYSQLAIAAPANAEVYYTLDGSTPTKQSTRYSEPIVIKQLVGDFPTCVAFRAKAYFADGTESEVVTQTFFSSFDIQSQYHNLVFSIVGNPADLTEGPDGILYGENYELRGRESERPVHIECFDENGSLLFDQDAGARIYGAASRSVSIKSLKLFARKSYDPEHGKFDFDGFQTTGHDSEIINRYDKLVLRNGGNDFQFAFIRDELNQQLAMQAGYTDYQAVMSAVVYLNGSYYGVVWLHETYCDDLLKDKYGGDTGKYVILEGTEREKDVDEDEPESEESKAAAEFNAAYESFIAQDLTDDAVYTELCAFMDVENYLQNYAFNIYVNNRDWPQNNFKCYRYYAGETETYETDPSSRLDGRWRFLFHDTDYSLGLYEQPETLANYNNLTQILDPKSERYSPLFAKLMERDDTRQYFLDEIHRLMDSVFTADNINNTLDDMNADRFLEMKRYFQHLEELKGSDKSIWCNQFTYQDMTGIIQRFAEKRAGYMEKFLQSTFPEQTQPTTE